MESKNSLQQRRLLTHYAPLVVWIAVILGLGTSLGSMNETSRFVRPLLEFIFPASSPETLSFIHGAIRKFAHFAEYAVLGFLAFRAFSQFALKRRIRFAAIFSLLLAAVVAATDEFQQSFDSARIGSPFDVLIDLIGAAAAVVLAAYFSYRWDKNQHQGF